METFTKLFGSLLALVYHCFDRIVINYIVNLIPQKYVDLYTTVLTGSSSTDIWNIGEAEPFRRLLHFPGHGTMHDVSIQSARSIRQTILITAFWPASGAA
jgi:hypothetical protein